MICMTCLTTGGPGKEGETNKLPPTGRIQKRSGERRWQSICRTNLPESFLLKSILAEWWVRHQEGLWVRMTGQRQTRNESHHQKTWDCKPQGTAALWAPSPRYAPPGGPSTIRFLALSACVSPHPIHLRVFNNSPLFGPGTGPLFLQHTEQIKKKKGTADLTMLRMNNIPKGSLGFLRAKELNTLLLNILYSIWQLSNQRMTQQTKMLILHNLLPIRLP